MSEPFGIGIDLGTTYCCVAVQRSQKQTVEIVPNDVGNNTTPSYVAYNLDEDEIDIYAGETAKDLAFENPENTIFDIKRLMGRTFYDDNVQRYNHLWPFHLVNMHGLVGVKIGDQKLLPQTIASELVSHLKKTAEDFLGCSIDSATVTVPVFCNEVQKDVTREACQSAGLTKVHFITEPEAAAIAYGIKSAVKVGQTKTCLIFDLGGGTFDVTIFTVDSNKQVEIKAMSGDGRLGGEDFNDLLTEYCIKEFKEQHGIDLAEGKKSEDRTVWKSAVKKLRRIRNECEKQKCFLSSTTKVVASLDGLAQDISMAVPITRQIFENLIAGHLERCILTLDNTLKKNGYKKGDIEDVILVGGSTRIPKVMEMVSHYFEGKRLHRAIDPDDAVARGAAIHACSVFHGSRSTSEFTLLHMVTQTVSAAVNQKKINLPKPILWKSNSSVFTPRAGHSAVVVGNTIYSFGGFVNENRISVGDEPITVYTCNTSNPSMEWKQASFTSTSDTPSEIANPTVVAYGAHVYLFGGLTSKNKGSNILYRLNTGTMTWDRPKQRGTIPQGCFGPSAVVIRDKMYIYGITSNSNNWLYYLDLKTLQWSVISTEGIPQKLSIAHSAVAYEDRYMIIFGGSEVNAEGVEASCNALAQFDVETNEWMNLNITGQCPPARSGHSAFMHNGFMYIVGGGDLSVDGKITCLKDVFRYDPGQMDWKEVSLRNDGFPSRAFAPCVQVANRVFLFGGVGGINSFLKDCIILEMQN